MTRTSLRLGGFLVTAFLALAGCGGGTGHFASTGDDGGPPPGDDILGDDALPPAGDGGPIDPRCASGSPIGTGFACGASGLSCPLGTITDCNGNPRTLQCFCDGAQWTCERVPTSDCAPPTSCPDPSTIYPGTSCSVSIGQTCYSTDIPSYGCGGSMPPPSSGTCTCTPNGWSCPQGPVPPCIAPQPCPDPYTVYPNTYCNSEGLTCSGNPSGCGGQVYYDALLCKGGSWLDVAPTYCDIYDGGGYEDVTYAYDAPYYLYDGGVVPEND